MKGRKALPISVLVYLAYLLFLCLVFAVTKAGHRVLRHAVVWALELPAVAGAYVVLIAGRRRLPSDSRTARRVISAALVLVSVALCLGLVFQLLFYETGRESVVRLDGQQKIRVERRFLLIYEVEYHDYETPFWYKAFPCVRESYDDGDPSDWVYTDYYDENGVLTERVFLPEDTPEG